MSAQLAICVWDDRTTARDLSAEAEKAPYLLVHHRSVSIAPHEVDVLVGLLSEPQAATVSPLEVPDAPSDVVTSYPLVGDLPLPPTLLSPRPACVLIRTDVLRALGVSVHSDWWEAWDYLVEHVVNRGWRHLAAPGLALGSVSGYAPVQRVGGAHRNGGWSDRTIETADGPANEGLSTHRLYADLQFRPMTLMLDAACYDAAPSNGTQALVMNVARALKQVRPDVAVMMAVPSGQLDAASREFADTAVRVVARDSSTPQPDVVYRPYQLLVPGELDWLLATGRRLVVGQLDMIGFSNPSYHPSSELFHAVRNLQRATLRAADATTYISEFGLRHALAECPDLDSDRCFVVSSGAASPPPFGADEPAVGSLLTGPYIFCLSASFWHKNRSLAISMFANLVADHGYQGGLILAGPDPYYGSSRDAENDLIAQLPSGVAERIRRSGPVPTAMKWALLRNADLVVYPSTVEGFGMIPFEAAGVGTPSLIGSGSALTEVFGSTGAIVESWDARVWAATAARLLEDRRLGTAIVEAIGQVELRHTWESVATKTWAAIDAIVARPRATMHVEEGGWRSQVVGRADVTRLARRVHFGNRVVAYGRRRTGRG